MVVSVAIKVTIAWFDSCNLDQIEVNRDFIPDITFLPYPEIFST